MKIIPISNIIVKNCKFSHIKVPVQDNTACIDFNQGGGTELGCQVINNYFEPDTILSHGVMCWANAADIIISNNEFAFCRYAFYYKFGLHGIGAKHPTFKNNFVHDMYGAAVTSETDSMVIKNNLIINTGIDIADLVSSSCDEAWGWYNIISHNTIINNTNNPVNYFGNTIGGYAVGGCAGADYTVITNNVFYEGHQCFSFMPYQDIDTSHTTFSYNLAFTDSTSSPITDHRNSYTLAALPASIINSNNIQSKPVFQIGTYRLASSSPGYHAASDGLDMGANMDSVGIQSGAIVQQILCILLRVLEVLLLQHLHK